MKKEVRGWGLTDSELEDHMENVEMPEHLDTLETRIDELLTLAESLKKMTMQEDPDYKSLMEHIDFAITRINEKLN